MAATYCYEGIPLRFLASLFDTDALSSAISSEASSTILSCYASLNHYYYSLL